MIHSRIALPLLLTVATCTAWAAGGVQTSTTGAERPTVFGVDPMSQEEAVERSSGEGGVLLGASPSQLGNQMVQSSDKCALYDTDCLLRDISRTGAGGVEGDFSQNRLSFGEGVGLGTGAPQRVALQELVSQSGGNSSDSAQTGGLLQRLLSALIGGQ